MKIYHMQLGLARRVGLLPAEVIVVQEPKVPEISLYWRQQGFSVKPVLFIDPKADPDDFKELKPKNHITILFTNKPSKPWLAWIKKSKVEYIDKGTLSKDQMKGLLIQGSPLLGTYKLTADAAEFVIETFADSSAEGLFNIAFTIENAKQPNQTLLSLDDIAELWPDPGFKLARQIAHYLGKREAIRLLLTVSRQNSESIFGLWRYLDIVCGSKHPEWLSTLQMFRSACDRKRYDYHEGLLLFTHYCYASKQRKPDLVFRCGIPALIGDIGGHTNS